MRHAEPESNQSIKRYLLGLAGEEEQRLVEERLFLYEDYFEQVKSVEDELVEGYVGGRLAGEEKAQFEKRYMATPQQQAGVKQSRLLRDYFDERLAREGGRREAVGGPAPGRWPWRRPSMKPAVRYLLPGAALATLLAAVTLGVLWAGGGGEPEQVRGGFGQTPTGRRDGGSPEGLTDTQGSIPEPTTNTAGGQGQRFEQAAGAPDSPAGGGQPGPASVRPGDPERKSGAVGKKSRGANDPAPRVVELALSAGRVRSGGDEGQGVALNPSALILRLLLLHVEPGDYRSYRAEVSIEGEQVIWQEDNLKPRRGKTDPRIILHIPAGILPRGDYKVDLLGVGAGANRGRVGTYYFRVVQEK